MDEYSAIPTSDTPPDCNGFFVGLIKLVWSQQSNFWTTYQKALHSPCNPSVDPILLQELRLEIQQLHSLKGQVPFHLRDRYFPHNMKEFLVASTANQLQNYVTNYKPAILKSISQAKQENSKLKKIHQFPGFTIPPNTAPPTSHRWPTEGTIPPPMSNSTLLQTNINRFFHSTTIATPSNPYSRHPRDSTISLRNTQHQPHTKRETFHRKHSRWKTFETMRHRFQAFFNPSTSTNTSTPPS